MFFLTSWLHKRRVGKRAAHFIKHPHLDSLEALHDVLIETDLPCPLTNIRLRSALLALPDLPHWVLLEMQTHLQQHSKSAHIRADWRGFLAACRSVNFPVDVLSPGMNAAIADAQRRGLLADLQEDDRRFLIARYLHSFERIITAPGDMEYTNLLEVLTEYTAILHAMNESKVAGKVLQRLRAGQTARPRALDAMSFEDSLHSPSCGVASPHRMAVTFYVDDSPIQNVVQMCAAGTTSDALLNERVFNGLFTAALSCDKEPTFLTSVGCRLSLNTSYGEHAPSLLSAVVGPAGLAEPTADAPTLGMTADDALMLLQQAFSARQEKTGLTRSVRWGVRDAQLLEERIRATLEAVQPGTTQFIKSAAGTSAGSSVIHIMPMLCRIDGRIQPVTIEFPYKIFGNQRVFDLLREAREEHMQALIAGARRRKEYSHETFLKAVGQMERWDSWTPQQKAAAIQQHPIVPIAWRFDPELGMDIRIDPPEEVAREEYEVTHVPNLIEGAKYWEERFDAMIKKLEQINAPGGKAEILTFKLLVDSLIRRADFVTEDKYLQDAYRQWRDACSEQVWKIIVEWANQNSIPHNALAADNVCFNARLNPHGGVEVGVFTMVDLHDYAICVNGGRPDVDLPVAYVQAFSQGNTPSLSDVFVPKASMGCSSIDSLFDEFVGWVAERTGLAGTRAEIDSKLANLLESDVKLHAIMSLSKAQRLIRSGAAQNALAILDSIRKADLAPVYFWGAVASQLASEATAYSRLLGATSENRPQASGHDEAVNRVINWILDGDDADQLESGEIAVRAMHKYHLAVTQDLLCQRSKTYLGQLRAKAPGYLERLKELKSCPKVEEEHFDLDESDREKLQPYIAAFSAIDLLTFAEKMKKTAQDLSREEINGEWDLRSRINDLVSQTEGLDASDSTLEALRRLREFAPLDSSMIQR